jgi:FAD/FMN-containing dehydrogenase
MHELLCSIPLVPQGGNTGLARAATPLKDNEVIVQLGHLNKIHGLLPVRLSLLQT